jgi:pantetheine-phosphate adenylyltransferase
MTKIAVFPGSFDPITVGHVDIVNRAIPLFDKIIIAIGINTQKQYLYSLEGRIAWLKEVFKNEPKIEIESYQGLTINFCKLKKAQYILRGIRSAADFEYEKTIAHLNHAIVREIIKGHGDVSKFVPKEIIASLNETEIK